MRGRARRGALRGRGRRRRGEHPLRQWAFSIAATVTASTGDGVAALFPAASERWPRLGRRSAHEPRHARRRRLRSPPPRPGARASPQPPGTSLSQSGAPCEVGPRGARKTGTTFQTARPRRAGPAGAEPAESWPRRRAMAGPEERLAPRPQAPPPAAGDQPGCGPGQLRPEPARPASSCAGRASPAGGPGAQCARGGGWVAARAPAALAFAAPAPPAYPPSFGFWPPPPPPPALLPSSAAFHLRVRRPGRGGAAAARGGGGRQAAPASTPPSGSPRGSGGRRRLVLCPALLGLLLPARAGPWPPPLSPPRLPLGPAARLAGSPGFALAAAAPLPSGSDMEDGPSNNASCFRRLTDCFLSPSKCRLRTPRWGRAGRAYRAFGARRARPQERGLRAQRGHRDAGVPWAPRARRGGVTRRAAALPNGRVPRRRSRPHFPVTPLYSQLCGHALRAGGPRGGRRSAPRHRGGPSPEGPGGATASPGPEPRAPKGEEGARGSRGAVWAPGPLSPAPSPDPVPELGPARRKRGAHPRRERAPPRAPLSVALGAEPALGLAKARTMGVGAEEWGAASVGAAAAPRQPRPRGCEHAGAGVAEGVSRGRGPRRSRVVTAEVRSKAAGGRCGGRRRRVRREGDRPCRGWRASEVRTRDPGRGQGPRRRTRGAPAAPAPSAGLGRHGPPRAHRAFVCCSLGKRASAAPSPGRRVRGRAAVSVSCTRLPRTPQPRPPEHPGCRPLLVAKTCPGAFGVQPGGRASVARGPPARARGGPRRPRGRRPRTDSRAGSSPAISLLLAGGLDLLGVGPGLC